MNKLTLKKIVKFSLRENELHAKNVLLFSRYETASNTHNDVELEYLNTEEKELERQIKFLNMQKQKTFEIIISTQSNFRLN